MELELSTEHQAFQAEVDAFARDLVAPRAAAIDETGEFPLDVIRAAGQRGLLGITIARDWGGAGRDYLSASLAIESIARASATVAASLVVHNALVTELIAYAGRPPQQERWLRRLASGEAMGAFALSEPEAGSDAASLRTQAVRDGDDWILNGTKAWVSSGTKGEAILAMARTDSPDDRRGPRGISAFIITPDLPGFSVGKKEDKMGLRASPTVQLHFSDMRVPGDRLLGQVGSGFIYAMQSLDNGRLGIAAQAVGIAEAALRAAASYAAERKQFGKPIKEFQAIQFRLADMATRVASARALMHAAATAKDRGEKITQFSSMAKLQASETAMWVTTQAIQIFGGYGYVKDYPVERLFRDAKVTEIYEGTSEIQRIVIARELYSHT
jgi:alkylation response protein AidB-like acyl-CoA dehydrogenase